MITLEDACKKLNIPKATASYWIKKGMVPSVKQGKGRGKQEMLDDYGYTFLAVIKNLRQNGISLQQLENIKYYHPIYGKKASYFVWYVDTGTFGVFLDEKSLIGGLRSKSIAVNLKSIKKELGIKG